MDKTIPVGSLCLNLHRFLHSHASLYELKPIESVILLKIQRNDSVGAWGCFGNDNEESYYHHSWLYPVTELFAKALLLSLKAREPKNE